MPYPAASSCGTDGSGKQRKSIFTLRCTNKFLARARFQPEPNSPIPTTALGDWYANILNFGRQQLFLFTCEGSRLALLTHAKNARSAPDILTKSLGDLLDRLPIPAEWVAAELREMGEFRIGRTRSRSILATMNDYKRLIWGYAYSQEVLYLDRIEEWLLDTPIGPLHNNPLEATFELLKGRYGSAGYP